ncbi:MAG TPA: hypothetical protein VJ672_01425, partial [Gemmatimonadaceae bacterium]|nr:hypothetical protein [Gemmatimonadaceae bacterium]
MSGVWPSCYRARRVALVTYEHMPLLYDDERPLVAALHRQGVDAEPVVWSEPSVRWSMYDAVILRSTWDYHTRYLEFRRWLAKVESLGVRVWNAPNVVRWNMNKHYLQDLARRGVRVADTVWLSEGTTPDVNAILKRTRWERVVVKPVVSASSYRTWTSPARMLDDELGRVQEMLSDGTVMLQRFMPEIVEQGELSLVYLGGRFSHAVAKRAAPGEFRVQNQFGGTSELVSVSKTTRRTADRILRTVGEPLLYARVDGVEVGGEFVLMELEVVEPYLFLELGGGYYEKAASVIREWVVGHAWQTAS